MLSRLSLPLEGEAVPSRLSLPLEGEAVPSRLSLPLEGEPPASRLRFVFLILLIAMAGCRKSPAPQPGAPEKQHATLVLNWFPEAEHGGFYAALAHGYFAQEGIDMEIIPGGPGAAVIPRVATGKVDFGVENADHVVLARAQSAPVVAVMAPIQTHPRCIMVHAASGITNLAGLRNMTLAMNPGGAFAHYLRRHAPLENVRIVPYAGNVSQFIIDKNLAQQAYTFSEPFAARAAGADPRCLLLADIGFNPYTSCLLTSERLLKENPTLVRAVVRASLRGWEQYLKDPAQTHIRIHEQNPEMSLAMLDFGQTALRDLCPPPLGAMTLPRWQSLTTQLTDLTLIPPNSVQPQSCFSTSFQSAIPK